jgi:DNA-binding XRE family transcriptional regulator
VLLKALKPERIGEQGDSLPAHLQRRRRELGLFRKQAARQIGVKEWTLLKWEHGMATPLVSFYPRIIAYLGYEPWPKPETLAEMLLAQRCRQGFSAKETAEMMGIDPGTYSRMEQGHVPGHLHIRNIIKRFVPNAPLPPLSGAALSYRRRREREGKMRNIDIATIRS